MIVNLDRIKHTANETFGMLTADVIDTHIFTIERPWLDNQNGISCIPIGTYECEQFDSPSKGDVWLLKGTGKRSMIEIHSANFAHELRGCIAPGDSMGSIKGVAAVLNSKPTMERLKEILPDKFTLIIEGEP